MKKKRRMKKRVRRRIALLVLLFLLLGMGFLLERIFFGEKEVTYESESAIVNEYYIYGTHLNMNGSLKLEDLDYESISLLLDATVEEEIDTEINKTQEGIQFTLSENINDGYYMENLERGEYTLCFKVTYEEDEKLVDKYYSLKNNTAYETTTYYTFSKTNNKVVISSKEEKLSFAVSENKDKNIYDITIDPGHGGIDSGSVYEDVYESEYVMEVAQLLKSYLEKEGFKVKLTHEEDELEGTMLADFNDGGRAVIPNEVKSKYTLSLHLNSNESSNPNGFEIYTPGFIDYSFAQSMAENLKEVGLSYSTNVYMKEEDGVYTYMLSEEDFNAIVSHYMYEANNTSERSNHMFIIRETGGYMSGSFMKEESEYHDYNPYANSNVGNETYLLELGYMTNSNNLEDLLKLKKEIAKALSKTIIEYCK